MILSHSFVTWSKTFTQKPEKKAEYNSSENGKCVHDDKSCSNKENASFAQETTELLVGNIEKN